MDGPSQKAVTDTPPHLETVDESEGANLPGVSFYVNGCAGATEGGNEVMLTVHPGWLSVNACPDDCESAEHELLLTWREAEEVVKALRAAVVERSDQRFITDAHYAVSVDWAEASAEWHEGVILDWTAAFLNEDEQSRHDAGTIIPGAYHSVLILRGGLIDHASETSLLYDSFSTSALASAWWSRGILAEPGVREWVAPFGAQID